MVTRRRSTYRTNAAGRLSAGRPGAEPEMTKLDMLEFLQKSLERQAVEPNLFAYVPHPKQAAFHESTATGRLYVGGNRSGKTVAGVVEDLWWLTRRHPYRRIPTDTEIRGRICGDGFKNGTVDQVLIPAVKRWVPPSELQNGSWEDSWRSAEWTLTLANGSFLEFKSYEQEKQKHAGTSRHFVHFDEEPPQELFIENMARLIDTKGLWWLTMTPNMGMTWVYDELFLPASENKLKNIELYTVSSTDNPYIDRETLEEMLQIADEAERATRMEGKFQEKGGLIFPDFGTIHLIQKISKWKPPPGWRVYMSIDHGVNNPTAVLWHAVSPNNDVITFKEHYASGLIVKEHAKIIKEIEINYGLREVWARPGDPAMKQRNGVTGTSIGEAYAEEEIYLSLDLPRDVKTGIDRMKTYLRLSADNKKQEGPPHWRIIEDECPNLVREMKRLHWATYASGKLNSSLNKQEQVHKKDDHAFDSARYFFTLLPDLTPDVLWHFQPKNQGIKSYIDTLIEMSQYQQETRWTPVGYGVNRELEMSNIDGDGME